MAPFSLNPHNSTIVIAHQVSTSIKQLAVLVALYVYTLVSVTRRVLVSLMNASPTSTRIALSLTHMYPLTKHAFHMC